MDKDIIGNGAVAAPREFFIKLHDIRIQLIRIQNEGDAHSNAVATKAIKLLDEALTMSRPPVQPGNILTGV